MALKTHALIACHLLWLMALGIAPVRSQDICSSEGKKKLQAADVTSTQIAKLCPPTAQSKGDEVHYRDVKTAILDASEARGKNIALRGTYRGLGTLGSRPVLKLRVDTDTNLDGWYVFFDKTHTDVVSKLRESQRLAIVCRIRNLDALGPECDLVAWDRP